MNCGHVEVIHLIQKVLIDDGAPLSLKKNQTGSLSMVPMANGLGRMISCNWVSATL